MSLRIVPRSAVGLPSEPSQPAAQQVPLRMAAPRTATQPAMPAAQAIQLLKGKLAAVAKDRVRIVNEANKKLGALVARVRQLEGMLRTAYGPGSVPPMPQPQPAPPPAQAVAQEQQAEATPIPMSEQVAAAKEEAFYGRGEDVFYEGGENDE